MTDQTTIEIKDRLLSEEDKQIIKLLTEEIEIVKQTISPDDYKQGYINGLRRAIRIVEGR